MCQGHGLYATPCMPHDGANPGYGSFILHLFQNKIVNNNVNEVIFKKSSLAKKMKNK